MPTPTRARPKRSIKLKEELVQDLEKRIALHPTKVAASLALGINKDVLDRARRIKSVNEQSFKILFPDVNMEEYLMELTSS